MTRQDVRPLPFPVEITSKIYDLLVPSIPLKLILLSKRHYDSLVPSIYKDIKFNASNADAFRYGIQCREDKSKDKPTEQAEEAAQDQALWNSRKCQACSHTEKLVLEDETCLMVLDSIVQSCLKRPIKSRTTEDEGENYVSKFIFPNVKKVIFNKSLINLLLSNPISEDHFENCISSLGYFVPTSQALHVDISLRGIDSNSRSKYISILVEPFRPSLLVLKIFPNLKPIPPQYIRKISKVKIYFDINSENKEEEDEIVKRNIIKSQMSLRFDNRNHEREYPVEFYLKEQRLIDYIEDRLMYKGEGDKDKWVLIRKWEEDEDWMN